MEKLTPDREHYVLNNMKLVHYIANNRFHVNASDERYEDIVQEGMYGLIKAAISFNESLGYEFSTYATYMIEGCIRRYKRDYLSGNGISVPRSLIDKRLEFIKMSIEDREKPELEILNKLNITHEDYLYITGQHRMDLDKELESGNDFYDIIEDINDDYEEIEVRDMVENALVHMRFSTEKKRQVYEEYIYSILYTGEKVRERDLSRKYGISQSYVNRIIGEYNKSLKLMLAN